MIHINTLFLGVVHRRRYFRRHPAFGGHEGLQDDRGHQQRPRGSHFPGGRSRIGRRSVQGHPGDE